MRILARITLGRARCSISKWSKLTNFQKQYKCPSSYRWNVDVFCYDFGLARSLKYGNRFRPKKYKQSPGSSHLWNFYRWVHVDPMHLCIHEFQPKLNKSCKSSSAEFLHLFEGFSLQTLFKIFKMSQQKNTPSCDRKLNGAG